jgi:curved DNA-binding protein CbpA
MVPPWATKAEIERKYQDLKRDLTKRTENSAAFVDVQKAYEILSSVDGRKDYDETIGLTKSLQSRVDLQPISMFSKSLSSAQRNWPTWERELLVVVISLEANRSLVAGAHVVVHTASTIP